MSIYISAASSEEVGNHSLHVPVVIIADLIAAGDQLGCNDLIISATMAET